MEWTAARDRGALWSNEISVHRQAIEIIVSRKTWDMLALML